MGITDLSFPDVALEVERSDDNKLKALRLAFKESKPIKRWHTATWLGEVWECTTCRSPCECIPA